MELEILVSCFFESTQNFVHSCEILLLEIVKIVTYVFTIKKKYVKLSAVKGFQNRKRRVMLSISKVVSFQEINDYVYIVNESNQKIYFLEKTAKYIWNLIENGVKSNDEIVTKIANLSLDRNIDLVKYEVTSFLNKLKEEGLLNDT